MKTPLFRSTRDWTPPCGDALLRGAFVAGLLLGTTLSGGSQTYVDLNSLFDTDAVLEQSGTGIGNALDADGRRLDATTLPAGYADGAAATTQDGRATFKFGTLKQSSKDALLMNGQVLDVTDGAYQSLDLALLSAPDALGYPFGNVELRYSDGSKDSLRLGPVPGWFNSPSGFDNVLYRFTDSSEVQTLVSFRTDTSDTEIPYIVAERGNGVSGGNRFVDGTGFVLYRIGDLNSIAQAKLGVTVGNNFVVSLATEYYDPYVSTTDGYTVVANSMEIYGGVDHHALGNYKQYDIDLASFLAKGTGEIYILFTDGSPSDGWGPYINQIQVYTGTPKVFEQVIQPVVNTNQATVYAMFKTDTAAEAPFMHDNSASGPSNRGHRFADGNQSLTYRFDLPDDVTNAKLTMDMANNFIVSLATPTDLVRYATVNAGTGSATEPTYLVDAGGSAAGSDYRFADASSYMIYQFDLPDDATTAFARVYVGNQFVIEAAAGTSGAFEVKKDWVADSGEETRDNSNLAYYDVDISPQLVGNPTKVVQIRLRDGAPADGWGPYLKSISIQNKSGSGMSDYSQVMDAQAMFGEDIHNEYNKQYYTLDLSSVLTNNPSKQFFVRLTDGSTSDGWGPGLFWLAVYSGQLGIQGDSFVFNGLKTTMGDPANYGAALLQRRYPVNSAKTLSTIALPAQTTTEDNKVYLLAATLNPSAAAPTVQVGLTSQNKLRIAWPTSATGYQLQSASTLSGPTWGAVSEPVQTVGNEFVVEVNPTDAARFYRLTK